MQANETVRVLVVEDSQDDTFLVVRALQHGGYQVRFRRVETAAAMLAALETEAWDLIISDYSIPGFGGAAALELYRQRGLDIPFIVVSGVIGEDRAVEMMKLGAHYYLMKEHLERLVPAVRQELSAAQQRRTRQYAESTASYLASLVESCDDAIIGTTLDGTVVSWNAGAEQLYDYTAAEIIGGSIARLFPPYRPEELPRILEKIKSGEHISRLETIWLRKDGSPVEVSQTISPVKDSSGRIIGASTVTRDITHRKDEENLRLALIRELVAALPRSEQENDPTVEKQEPGLPIPGDPAHQASSSPLALNPQSSSK